MTKKYPNRGLFPIDIEIIEDTEKNLYEHRSGNHDYVLVLTTELLDALQEGKLGVHIINSEYGLFIKMG